MIDLDWLDEWVSELPEKIEVRKNLIDIAGYPTWENVNSNLLAFYFDKTEEHGFGSLFIDALLELIDTNDSVFGEGDFSVAREVRSKTGKRIDIVITHTPEEEVENEEDEYSSANWAVVIENKINDELTNDLGDYWQSINADQKLGFVLSKKPIDLTKYNKRKEFVEKDIFYRNITHAQLIEEVQEGLPQCFLDADDRHLLFLKEFIANTNNFYTSDAMNKSNDQALQLFHDNGTNITTLKKQDKKLLEYITEAVIKIFKENGFKPSSDTASKGKHFYAKEDTLYSGKLFRFYVSMNSLRYQDTFSASYELYAKRNTKFGSAVKSKLKEKGVFTSKVIQGTGGGDKTGYQHIYSLRIPIGDFSEIGFEAALRNALETHFWNHPKNFLSEIESSYKSVSNPDGK